MGFQLSKIQFLQLISKKYIKLETKNILTELVKGLITLIEL